VLEAVAVAEVADKGEEGELAVTLRYFKAHRH
jgi:hypothetical protein